MKVLPTFYKTSFSQHICIKNSLITEYTNLTDKIVRTKFTKNTNNSLKKKYVRNYSWAQLQK